MIKYDGVMLTFMEVPDEISLCINCTCCPLSCKGCFEPWLREDRGRELTFDEIDLLLSQCTGVTCVCFMGGDQNISELSRLVLTVKKYNLKVALYSGLDDDGTSLTSLHKKFDYIKLGHYDKTLGGLNQKTTNQRMYQRVNDILEDITYKFWKEDKTNDSN